MTLLFSKNKQNLYRKVYYNIDLAEFRKKGNSKDVQMYMHSILFTDTTNFLNKDSSDLVNKFKVSCISEIHD